MYSLHPDTDFTVIMDKLRKYGKEVWLVTRASDKDKQLFTSSSDKILVIDDYFSKPNKKELSEIENILTNLGFSKGGLFGTK